MPRLIVFLCGLVFLTGCDSFTPSEALPPSDAASLTGDLPGSALVRDDGLDGDGHRFR